MDPTRDRAPPEPGIETQGPTAGTTRAGLVGLFGRPYIPLERYLDLTPLESLHEEICLALAQVPTDYTGGSHRSMGIMPEGLEHEALTDYGEVIQGLDAQSFEVFRSLADDPSAIDPAQRHAQTYGEERDIPLSRRQMLWLQYRHRVYFPWKVYLELIPNRWWSDKANPEGKRFTRTAQTLLPRTIAFVRSLPFTSIGRCNVMGLQPHDHGTVHRDGDPAEQQSPDHFITFCPAPGKRLYLWDATRRQKVPVEGRAYWFNDHDYHGVEADPFFRYSVRVDGVFDEAFLAQLRRDSLEGRGV